jgi:hypothetical protein
MKENIAQRNKELQYGKEASGPFLIFKGEAVMLLNMVGENHVLVSFNDGDEKVVPVCQIDGIYSPPQEILIP